MSFANKQPPKKKRKSRTAFTNHQIFELEKRFLYQKYLSPADRDEIAAALGLTNAQVSTFIVFILRHSAKFSEQRAPNSVKGVIHVTLNTPKMKIYLNDVCARKGDCQSLVSAIK